MLTKKFNFTREVEIFFAIAANVSDSVPGRSL